MMERRLAILHEGNRLNDSRVVQAKWFRRDHHAYDFVCYVNNVIALFAAENVRPIPVIVGRVISYLSSDDRRHLSDAYLSTLLRYLSCLLPYLKETGQWEEGEMALILAAEEWLQKVDRAAFGE